MYIIYIDELLFIHILSICIHLEHLPLLAHNNVKLYVIRLQMIKVSIAMFCQIPQLGLGFLLNLIGSLGFLLNLIGSFKLPIKFSRKPKPS